MPGKVHLFTAARWLLMAAILMVTLLMAVLFVALGALGAIALSANHFGMPDYFYGAPRSEALGLAALILSGGLFYAVMVLLAFISTVLIVDTANSGDPFVNENARRLRRIGWFLFAGQVVGWLTNLTFDYLEPENLRGKINGFGFDVSPIGLLAILLIFVLAQIFRHGSEMRAELEGTI